MKMMFCPYWQKECLGKNCSSFHYIEHTIFEDKNKVGYEIFTKEKRGDWWYAVDIPYCRTMKIEIPINKTDA